MGSSWEQRGNRAADGFIPSADGDRVGVGGCGEEGRQYKNKLFHGGISLPPSTPRERQFAAVVAICPKKGMFVQKKQWLLLIRRPHALSICR